MLAVEQQLVLAKGAQKLGYVFLYLVMRGLTLDTYRVRNRFKRTAKFQ
jgi:hypothetical protein